jgi:hypothetical protein
MNVVVGTLFKDSFEAGGDFGRKFAILDPRTCWDVI